MEQPPGRAYRGYRHAALGGQVVAFKGQKNALSVLWEVRGGLGGGGTVVIVALANFGSKFAGQILLLLEGPLLGGWPVAMDLSRRTGLPDVLDAKSSVWNFGPLCC